MKRKRLSFEDLFERAANKAGLYSVTTRYATKPKSSKHEKATPRSLKCKSARRRVKR